MTDTNKKTDTIWLVQFPDGAKSFLDIEPPEYMKAYATAYTATQPAEPALCPTCEAEPASPSGGPCGVCFWKPAEPAQGVGLTDDAFERALKQTWGMVDPYTRAAPGSYEKGRQQGLIDALKTIKENYAAARAILARHTAPTKGEAEDQELRTYRQALEIIGVRDCADPAKVAAEALVATGFWSAAPTLDSAPQANRADFERLWLDEQEEVTPEQIEAAWSAWQVAAAPQDQATAFAHVSRGTEEAQLASIDISNAPQEQAASRAAVPEGLRERVLEAWANYERMGEVCSFEGQPMIYASTLEDLAQLAAPQEGKAVEGGRPMQILSDEQVFQLRAIGTALPKEAHAALDDWLLGVQAPRAAAAFAAQQTSAQVDAPEGGE